MTGNELVRTTPFPNELFRTMALLRDTEWRVLCVIVRFTLGFVDERRHRRKTRAAISHHQFKRWTGREGAAISGAIDRLVRKDIIVVFDYDGQPLGSREERRRAQSLLIYGVSTRLLP